MSESPQQEEFAMDIRGAIVKVQPHTVNELILKELSTQLLEEIEEIEGEKRLEEIPRYIVKLIDDVLRPYLSSRLGGQILDPRFSEEIVMDRILQFSEIIMSVALDKIRVLMDEIESGVLKSEDIERRIRRIILTQRISFLVIREIANRIFTVLQINAPIQARPPLVNSLEGIELIGGE